MTKTKFGVAIVNESVQRVGEQVVECDDFGEVGSEIPEEIFTAFVQPSRITLNVSERSLFGNKDPF